MAAHFGGFLFGGSGGGAGLRRLLCAELGAAGLSDLPAATGAGAVLPREIPFDAGGAGFPSLHLAARDGAGAGAAGVSAAALSADVSHFEFQRRGRDWAGAAGAGSVGNLCHAKEGYYLVFGCVGLSADAGVVFDAAGVAVPDQCLCDCRGVWDDRVGASGDFWRTGRADDGVSVG